MIGSHFGAQPLRFLFDGRRGDGRHLQRDDLPFATALRKHIRYPVLPAGVLPAVLALHRRQAGHHRDVSVDPHGPVARFERVESVCARLDVGQALRLRKHAAAGVDEGQVIPPNALECCRVLALECRDILVGELRHFLFGVGSGGDFLPSWLNFVLLLRRLGLTERGRQSNEC